MRYINLTKLVNGYQPVRIMVNPAAISYVEPRFSRSGKEDVEKGANVHFVGDDVISVAESVEQLIYVLHPQSPPSRRTFAFDVEAEREQAGVERG